MKSVGVLSVMQKRAHGGLVMCQFTGQDRYVSLDPVEGGETRLIAWIG